MNTIIGKAKKGAGYGRKIGFPTVNLDRRQYSRLRRKPLPGIYAGTARIVGKIKKYKAAIVIGPPERSGLPKIEAHLLGFTGVLYGKRVELSLIKYLRNFMSFTTEETLKGQIVKDIRATRVAINLTE